MARKILLIAAMALGCACKAAPKRCLPRTTPAPPPSAILTQAKEAAENGNYQLAIDITSQMIMFTGDPEAAQTWAVRGSAYYLMGKKSKAKTAWKRAYEIDPCMQEIPELIKKVDAEPR